MQECVNLVDIERCCKRIVYLQIGFDHPRTSPANVHSCYGMKVSFVTMTTIGFLFYSLDIRVFRSAYDDFGGRTRLGAFLAIPELLRNQPQERKNEIHNSSFYLGWFPIQQEWRATSSN